MTKQAFMLAFVGLCGALASAGTYAQATAETAPQSESALEQLTGDSPTKAAEAPAPASPAPPAPQQTRASGSPELEEIVVTARKRKESIQSVPLAVTAVSGEKLERANVTDINGLAAQVPSLVIVPGSSGSKAIPTFAIRGQSQQELTILADPSVPVYFNDVVVERQQGINQALFDIQSVEVLKGPQGTLFGRNSTGGAINVRAKPPVDLFEGYVGVTVGNFGRFNTTAMVNQPLADWAQLRVAGQTTDSDGFLEDVVLDKLVNHEHTKAGRISLALQPFEGLDSLFTYSRFTQNDGGTGALVTNLNQPGSDFEGEPESDPGSFAASCTAGDPRFGAAQFLGYSGDLCGDQILADQEARGIYKTASGADQYTRISTWDLANTTSYTINDALSVKNIIGWREVSGSNHDDVDGMPIPLIHIERFYDFRQFSEEFQLLGQTDTLSWIVGLYYFNEEGGTDDYSITVKPANAPPGNQIPQPSPTEFPGWALTDPDGENTSKSIFAQGTQRLDALLDGLALTIGARYTWDDRKAIVRNRAGNAMDPDGPQTCRFSRDLDGDPSTPETPASEVPIEQCVASFEETFSEPTYNISLDYQYTPSNLVYLAHRRGYRTGGFGARASSERALSETYDAEIVSDIEFGSKNDFNIAGMVLRLNVALYYSDYEDIQRLLTDPDLVPPQTVPVNAGKATIQGGELEFAFLPSESIEISGFYSYTDAGYDEFKDFSVDDPATEESEFIDRSGQPFARAPENIYSLTARYTLPVRYELGEPSLQVNHFYTDGYSTNDSFAPQQSVEDYELLNLRADWSSFLGSSVDIGVFVHNALDEEYLVSFSDIFTSSAIGHVSRTPGAPRTYGLELRYRFGGAAAH